MVSCVCCVVQAHFRPDMSSCPVYKKAFSYRPVYNVMSCLEYRENAFMSSILRRKTLSVLSTTINTYIHITIYTYVRMYVYTYIHKTINTQGCNAAFMYIHKTIRMYIRMVPQNFAFVKHFTQENVFSVLSM